MLNISAFGDSVLQGVVCLNGNYHLCRNRFTNIINSGNDIKIHNNGVVGHTIENLPKALQKAQDQIADPDTKIVLLEYGGNDCDFNWQDISNDPTGSHLCKTEISCFSEKYIGLISYLQSKQKDVFLLTLPPIDPYKYIDFLCRKLDRDKIMEWLENDIEFLRGWHELYNIAVHEIAHKAEAELIDITTPFLSKRNYTHLLCEDGIHPNEEGHRVIAEAILNHLGELP